MILKMVKYLHIYILKTNAVPLLASPFKKVLKKLILAHDS